MTVGEMQCHIAVYAEQGIGNYTTAAGADGVPSVSWPRGKVGFQLKSVYFADGLRRYWEAPQLSISLFGIEPPQSNMMLGRSSGIMDG